MYCQKAKIKTHKDLNPKAKIVRRNETMKACSVIHGASENCIEPVVDGMIDTLTSKCKAKELSNKLLNSKSSVSNLIKTNTINEWSKRYYHSEENVLRSLNIYYSHHLMGKAKYLSNRKANTSLKKTSPPNYVPYKILADKINNIGIGVLNDVKELLKSTNDKETSVKGVYCNPAEYVLKGLPNFI